jgi:hypothetical protein
MIFRYTYGKLECVMTTHTTHDTCPIGHHGEDDFVEFLDSIEKTLLRKAAQLPRLDDAMNTSERTLNTPSIEPGDPR